MVGHQSSHLERGPYKFRMQVGATDSQIIFSIFILWHTLKSFVYF